MHELGLANNILDIVRQYVPAERACAVRSVRVRVGDLAGVVPDSLAFCFSAIVIDTPYDRASLAIDHVVGPDLQVADIELEEETP
ncbi:MAG TPA: hydrogenase maturation nickel metallochaperone HypA [Vicinamibacterales bacterium]|nr:hydrogenase maturation nickel metallochaperone HypA [Vicinamibacterales bacterium]